MAKKEAKCAICKRALSGIETWGPRLHLCENPDCRARFTGNWHAIHVSEGERKCAWRRCDKTVPAGYYWASSKLLTCSKRCQNRVEMASTWHVCASEGCAKRFKGPAPAKFCSMACRDAEARARVLRRLGRWQKEFVEYDQFICEHYSRHGVTAARVGMAVWFEFLGTTDITDIADVDATTVSAWIAWGKMVGRPAQGYLHFLSTYMEWRIFSGLGKDNPVTRFHRRRAPTRLPRPYTEREMAIIWSLLERRGTTVTRLACALAEEGGPRVGELANARLGDVDLVGRRLFIRLPNKTMTERWVPYHDKTDKYLRIWLAERDPSVKHDHLLHQPNGRPYKHASLHYAIARVVCKTVLHKKVNEDGLDRWSTHRLRHVMASRLVENGADAATVMAVGGWVSPRAMAGYAAVSDNAADRGYREAMARAAERKERPQTKHSSFAKYVNRQPKRAA